MRGGWRCNVRGCLSLALVGRDVLRATEDLESGVALNTILLAEIGLFCAVDLDELDVLLLQGSGSLFVFWGEGLAVATPWGEDCVNAVRRGWQRRRLWTMEYIHSARTMSFS